MNALHTAFVDGRMCCAANEEVWVAKQSGGIAVFSARSGNHLKDMAVTDDDGATAAQITHMMVVFGEVWVSTKEGRVRFYELLTHTPVDSILIPGAERKVQVVSLSFNGHIAVIATASGSVYVHHPLTHKRLRTLSTSTSPCTAAIQFYSFVVGGDRSGAVYLWDPVTGECVIYHAESKSEVVALLHEPTTGTIWVSRANEHVDVYAVVGEALQLQRRVSGIGRVTGMVAVSGTVVATTFTKSVAQIDAATAKVTANVTGAHTKFIYGCCKAMHQEVAQVWSVGNDGALRTWNVVGLQVPAVPLPQLPPTKQAALTSSMEAKLDLALSHVRLEAQSERNSRATTAEQLGKAREEAQELRLRVFNEEEKRLAADAELKAERERRKELEESNARLAKEVTDITSSVAVVERECHALRGEVTQLKMELSKARTEASAKQTEKSSAEKQLSEERTNKSTLEQRLRDAEGRLASLQAEHRRVCESLGSANATQPVHSAAEDDWAKSNAALSRELEQARRMKSVMSSAIASMEYTIRRREEEHRDLTALLNAFRGRVADRVTDPNLSALLLATIVRNAPRFDLLCDEFTKAQLMEHNGPFLQFIQILRATDPEAYQKLIQYLQNPSIVQGLPADVQVLLDRLVARASREGEVSAEDIVNFKKTIPALTDPAALQGSGLEGAGTCAGAGGSVSSGGNAVSPGGSLSSGGGGLTTQDGAVKNALIRELREQRFIDENYIREQHTMFEFILKTRRLLVESLAVLYKRATSARQVVEALCLSTSAGQAPASAAAPSRKSLQPLQIIFTDVVRELEDLISDVMQRFLSGAEKQRLGLEP
ncbi:hypothetical protein CUR178_06653 [Leishmania enriettii]|uniref:Guanine nucleotide-binding protein subunit beta-like protein n=1 Tax=Leishmania enriettii TaxID=5663 RepID=A0A836HYP4_LEIEN|nr:hypothetical protein CUR178_06653 [Leishmania enriettii]